MKDDFTVIITFLLCNIFSRKRCLINQIHSLPNAMHVWTLRNAFFQNNFFFYQISYFPGMYFKYQLDLPSSFTHMVQSTNIWSYYGIMIWIDRWVFLRLVVVGGDGTLLEVINGLLTRAQKEAGLDYDKPTCKLKPLEVPIGIIPTGVKIY